MYAISGYLSGQEIYFVDKLYVTIQNLVMDFNDRQHKTTKFILDCKRVIEHFGGLANTARIMRDSGVPMNVGTVEKWRRRGSIPSAQLITLAVIAKDSGLKFNLYDFITERTNES